MIRKPISPTTRIILGISSFCALIAAYTWLANSQYAVNPTQMTTPGWTQNQQLGVIRRMLPKLRAAVPELEAAIQENDTKTAELRAALSVAQGENAAEKVTGIEAEIETLSRQNAEFQNEIDLVAEFEAAELQVAGAEADGDEAKREGTHKSILKGFQKITTEDDGEPAWLFADFGVSLKRFVLGVLFGTALAFVVGIAMGCFTPVDAFLNPPIAFLASIPPTAMIVVYMLVFKLRPELFIAVIGIGIFPTLAQAIYQAVKNDVPETSVNKAYTLGASNFEVIWEVVIPQILPRIIDAIRLQLGPAMIFLIAVELFVGSEGIGYRLKLNPRGNHYNVTYIYLICLGIIGMLLDWGLAALRRWLCPWFEASK